MHADIVYSHADMTLSATSGQHLLKFEKKTAQMPAPTGFGSAFLLPHQLVGFLLVIFGSRFLDNSSTDSKKVYNFGNCDSMGLFPLMQPIRHFCSLTPKMWLKWTYRRPRVAQMAVTTNASRFEI